MIRPEEAPGLTAALADAIDRKTIDLATLISNATYREQLEDANMLRVAHRAHRHLFEAEAALRVIATALAAAIQNEII